MKIVNTLIILMFAISSLSGFAQKSKKKDMELKNELDSVSYALGSNIASNLKTQGIDNINVDAFSKALKDVLEGKDTMMTQQEAADVLNNYMKELQEKQNAGLIAEGKEFLEKNAKKEGVVTLPNGIQYEVLKDAEGPKPKLTDQVTTHYHGMLIDGTVFDSSVERGQPATFPLNGVIKGWQEALQLMSVGAKWRIYLPYDMAYGPRGTRGIPPYSTLIFEVELISIN